MASTAAPQFLLANPIFGNHPARGAKFFLTTNSQYTTHASRRPPPGVDTRIHWNNEDEGWIGGTKKNAEEKPKNLLGENFADLLSSSSGSHYE